MFMNTSISVASPPAWTEKCTTNSRRISISVTLIWRSVRRTSSATEATEPPAMAFMAKSNVCRASVTLR